MNRDINTAQVSWRQRPTPQRSGLLCCFPIGLDEMEMKMKMALERAAREEACTHFPACEGTKAGPGCGYSARMEKMCCQLDQIHTYIHAESGGRYRTAADEDNWTCFLSSNSCIISTSIIIRAVYKFHFHIKTMMAVSFFSTHNNNSSSVINYYYLSHHALHPADGYYCPITSTISHRPGEIKQSNHANEWYTI